MSRPAVVNKPSAVDGSCAARRTSGLDRLDPRGFGLGEWLVIISRTGPSMPRWHVQYSEEVEVGREVADLA